MRVGTKSVLFGAHQFLIHPIVLFIAWWKLYGFPWDPRLWVAFLCHDWGYLGKPNLDGPEGETHVEFGASIMHFLFDRPRKHRINTRWRDFCLYHSRFYAKKHGAKVSKLCIADKMAIAIMPAWLWVLLSRMSGELDEYLSTHKSQTRYVAMNSYDPDPYRLYANIKVYLRKWVKEHKDCQPDNDIPEHQHTLEGGWCAECGSIYDYDTNTWIDFVGHGVTKL